MQGVLRALASTVGALVLVLVGFPISIGTAAPATDDSAQVYVYDGHHHNSAPTSMTGARSPPSIGYTYASDSTAGDASSRASDPTTRDTYGYDATTTRLQAHSNAGTTIELARAINQNLALLAPAGVAAKTATGSESALSGALLKNHLRQLETYGQGGFRELQSGRYRYYGNLTPAAKQGEMAGRRLVREWDPATGATRTWHETIDRSGKIRIVRPETGGAKIHYPFDEYGNFGDPW